MRKKVGTILDEDVLWRAKQVAAKQKKSLSDLLEQALRDYLAKLERINGGNKGSLVAKTRGAMSISRKQLKAVFQEKAFYEA